MTTARKALTALALTAALALAGCGDDEPDTASQPPSESQSPSEAASPSESQSPSESASPGASVEVTIEGDSVSPMAEAVEVGVGQPLVLDITSDRAGELHAHSNPEQTVAVTEGEQRVEMTFDKPGQVDIEEHESGALILRVLVQ